MTILAAATLLLAGLSTWLGIQYLRARAARRQEGWFGPYPIPKVTLESLGPRFAPGPFGPTTASEVTFLGRGTIVVPGGTTDTEAWVLSVLARDASRIFEFGTCTGKTTYLLARNAPSDARVTTLTLTPEILSDYQPGPADGEDATAAAKEESQFTSFLYSGTDAEQRIRQLYGDSKAFDDRPFAESFDLVFVDGSHAYSYVVSDSAKALRMVRPGGIVVWHDYSHENRDLFSALNDLARRVPLVHLAGTTLVAHRAGGAIG